MIVRDEETMLADCLASVRGAVDDIVVLDTGSTDATVAIARAGGARVESFRWIDDFAAARNAALAYARGDWILHLDADERLSPGAGGKLRGAVAKASFDCGMLRLHDASAGDASARDVLSGSARLGEVQLVARLLRRTPDLKFVDAIHENVMPWLRRRGMRVTGVDADIVHLGATETVIASKAKVVRNSRLLEARLERDPQDISAYGYLAHEHLRAGSNESAWQVIERGWTHLVSAQAQFASVHRLALARAYLLIARRDYPGARETARIAIDLDGRHPDFLFLDAFAWEAEARSLEGADRNAALFRAHTGYSGCLEFSRRVFAQAFVCGASSWAAQTRLATVSLLLGQPEAALTAFERALALRPNNREASLGRVEALLDGGDAARALSSIESHLSSSPNAEPDAWTLAALAVSALGLSNDAAMFSARATALAGRSFLAPHRRARLASLVSRYEPARVRGRSCDELPLLASTLDKNFQVLA